MENYKAKVKKRVTLLSLTDIFIAVIYILLISGAVMDTPSVPDFVKGYNAGAFIGLELVLIFFTVKYFVSMNNETALKKLYIEENDERRKLIMQKTGNVGMVLCTVLLAIATIISGFFNQTVFYTLLGATFLCGLIRLACKLYYHNKL